MGVHNQFKVTLRLGLRTGYTIYLCCPVKSRLKLLVLVESGLGAFMTRFARAKARLNSRCKPNNHHIYNPLDAKR